MTSFLELFATAGGLLGTWLIRKPGRWMRWGFVCWCFSNPAAMAFMYLNQHWALLLQVTVYWALALVSVRNWWMEGAT